MVIHLSLDMNVGNLGLLCSHALDLIGCMHLSLEFSRYIIMENNGFKNHYKMKDLEKKYSYLDLDVHRSIPCGEKHAQKNWRIFLYAAIHVLIPCNSRVVLVHMTCMIPVCFSYTQDLPLDDFSLCLGIEMVEILRVEARVFSLD